MPPHLFAINCTWRNMQPQLTITVEKNHPTVPNPAYASEGAMAFDLCAWLATPGEEYKPGVHPAYITLKAGERFPFNTGIKVELPPGYGLFMNVRSGLGAKHGIQIVNNQGWIDSDYRGNIIACLLNTGHIDRDIQHGERIVQCVVMPVPAVFFKYGKVGTTERGEGGFGSTGA